MHLGALEDLLKALKTTWPDPELLTQTSNCLQ